MDLKQSELLGKAKEAAVRAGEYILSEFQNHHDIKVKDAKMSQASQVVSEVDIRAQEIILKALELEDYPEIGILSEELEFDNSRFEKPYFWCIDPMDGTLPFLEGKSGFSVAIALLSKEGVPQLSVVYDPLNNSVYHAIKGEGAFLNDQPFKIPEAKNRFSLYCDRSLLNTKVLEEIKAEITEETGLQIDVIAEAGAVINAISVLENPPAAYIKPTKERKGGGGLWDFAATVNFFRELNLNPTSYNQEALDLNPKESVYFNKQGVRFSLINKHSI